LEQALAGLGEMVTDLSFQTGGAFGTRLRKRFGDQELQRQVRGAIEGTMANVREPGVPQPARWWSVAGFLQLLFFLTVITCGVWIWARPDTLERGSWPWPLIAAAAALLLSMAVAALVQRSGRKAGRVVAGSYRQAVEGELAAQLSRRVGVPIRTVLRERAELEGSLAELALQVARADQRAR
jgi:hypothetical protein